MAYTAIFPNQMSVFIAPAGTNGSSVTAAHQIVGEITNWKISGGTIGKDIVNVFGGQLDIRKPREMLEVSFDIYVNNTAASMIDRWSTYAASDGSSASLPTQKAIFISGVSNSLWNTFAANYADVTTSDVEQAADDALKFTITFKVVPVSTLGVANIRSSQIAYSTSYFNW